MKVWVIRHGESKTNREGLWTGWLDVPLTEKGRSDAEKAGKLLSDIHFDRVYSSDLMRAKSTAEIAIHGCETVTTPELREINVGSISGKPLSILTEEQRQEIGRSGYKQFDGEGSDEFSHRVSSFLRGLEDLECDNIALFSHAGWLRRALDHVLGERLTTKNILCRNCTVAIFEYENCAWRLHSWINLD